MKAIHLLAASFLYLGIMMIIGVQSPIPRLWLFPLLGILYFYKDKVDFYIGIALREIRILKILKIILIILILVRSSMAIRKIGKPHKHPEDQTQLYIDSVENLFKKGLNPYHQEIDPEVVTYKGETVHYNKMKYPPLQILTYAPFIILGGIEGIMLSHLLIYFLILFVLMKILNMTGRGHALFGGILYLGTEFYYYKAINKSINDFFPLLLIISSLYFYKKNKENLSGVLLGLSIAAKQVPGGFIAFYFLFQRKFKHFFISCTIFALVCIPFLITGFKDFLDNVVIWSLLRDGGGTIPYLLPGALPQISIILVNLFIFMAAFMGHREGSRFNLKNNWELITFGPMLFLLFSKVTFTNHFVWTVPFFIIWYLVPKYRENHDH